MSGATDVLITGPGQEARYYVPQHFISQNSILEFIVFLLTLVVSLLPILKCRGLLSTIILVPATGAFLFTILLSILEFLGLVPKGFFPAIFVAFFSLAPLAVGFLVETHYRKKHPSILI